MRILFIYTLVFILTLPNSARADERAITNDAQLAAVCSLLKHEGDSKSVAGADYVPGIDVYGRSVKSANIEGGDKPQNYRFNFSLDLAQRYMNLPEGVDMKTDSIPLDISSDGKVSFGSEDRTQELHGLCKDLYGQ